MDAPSSHEETMGFRAPTPGNYLDAPLYDPSTHLWIERKSTRTLVSGKQERCARSWRPRRLQSAAATPQREEAGRVTKRSGHVMQENLATPRQSPCMPFSLLPCEIQLSAM
ncbi:hypothetical protein SEVIR_5G021450v4 [Setaria viridis]